MRSLIGSVNERFFKGQKNIKTSCNQKKDVLIFSHQKSNGKCIEGDSCYEKRQEYGVTD